MYYYDSDNDEKSNTSNLQRLRRRSIPYILRNGNFVFITFILIYIYIFYVLNCIYVNKNQDVL